MGDFNEIISNEEKVGSRPRDEQQMVNLREDLKERKLYDLSWKGDKYTWE